MKILIVYASRETGNSRKIAEALASEKSYESVLACAADAPSPEKFDAVALCFGIYRGWPDGDMIAYMKRCRRKDAALFMTLGAWPDSEHAFRCFGRAEGLLESCDVRVRFICQGGYTQKFLEHMKNLPPDSPHGWNPEREKRVMEAMKHPDSDDLANAVSALRAALEKIADRKPRPERPAKKAVVLSVFGTTVPEAESAYDVLENSIRFRTALPVFRAYTSPRVRARLKYAVPSLAGVLKQLVTEEYTAADVVAGYLASGEEYEKVLRDISAFERSLTLHVNRPPLASRESLRKFLPCLTDVLPPERAAGESVVFMGHGHEDGRSDFQYMALDAELNRLDADCHAACVEGEPSFDSVLPKLKPGRVWLVPFLMVAGDHARNDLAGEGADSWRSRLAARGFEVKTVLKGLGEYPPVADYFTEGLK